MKLAEALVLRADCQRRISQLKPRLERVIKVQEGELPGEQPEQLFEEINKALDELTEWVTKINKTNALTVFDANRSIADALAERDQLMQHRSILTSVLDQATIKQDRYSRSEVKYYRTIDVQEIQKQVDLLSKKYRELDFKIQEKNWTIELIED
jgi:hypothetical protein